MAITNIRKNLRTLLIMIGAGLIFTYAYVKVMEAVPKVSISKKNSERPRLEASHYEDSVDIIANAKDKIYEGDCRWKEPWFNHSITNLKRTQMIFFGKPIMQSLKTIATGRHWKMALILNDSKEGILKLHNYLTSDDTFTVVITSSRFYKHFAMQNLSQSKSALVSAIRYAFKITGGKKGQLTAFRDHFAKYGCELDDLEVMPRSFLLDDSKECLHFFKFANQNPNSWWVLKESSGYGGTGITIHRNLTDLYTEFGMCKNSKAYVIQQYIPNLLLLNKRKFDVRGLVLIASTQPYLLFHHDGYLRVAMRPFSPGGGNEVHLTNSHMQINAENYSPDKHLWTFERFQKYLDEHHPDNRGFVTRQLVPAIKKTALFILQTGRSVFASAPSSYQLLGLDFMVSSDLHVWFIEANNYPLWPVGSRPIDKLIHTMGNDMFDLLFKLRLHPLQFTTMRPGTKYKSWELVWNEMDEKCSNEPAYNPCSLFNS